MTPIAEARAAVRHARRRLLATAAVARCADGVLWGSAAGSALAVGLVLVRGTAPLWLAALPAAGALIGIARALLAPPREEDAALALDRRAGTEEAFLAAVSAVDADDEFRALAAGYALERCPARRVSAVLPMPVPPGAPRAVVSFALLIALVAVPAAAADAGAIPEHPAPVRVQGAPGSSGGSAASSPADRAQALLDALEQARGSDAEALAPAVRRALPELGAEDLAALARQIAAAEGPAGEAARRALAALAAGRLDEAAQALHQALGGSLPAAHGADGGAGEGVSAPGSRASRPGPWSAPRWPLRYDRQVQRWLELAPPGEGSGPGGNR